MKYRFMIEHRHDYAITLMCRVLRVSRAGFYAWLRESVCDHAKEDERLLILIRASYQADVRFPPILLKKSLVATHDVH